MNSAITVICLVTSDCNLNCVYCYTRAAYPNKERISLKNAARLVQNCASGFNSIEFCWHGGEPLLVGKNFYEAIIEAQREITEHKNGIKFINTIQSNCLLLDDELLHFFKENRFRIGSTFEAPPAVHLRHRPSASGKSIRIGNYLKVFQKIKAASLPLGLLCVITKENVACGEEIFDFFKEIGANTYSLLPLIEVPRKGHPEPPTNDELFELYKTTFQMWLSEKNNFASIEPIETMVRSLLGERPQFCSFASSCLKKMISISPKGEVVPCGSLSSFQIGNIFEKPLIEILHGKAAQQLRDMRVESMNRLCDPCRYISICRGGCREMAFWQSGDYGGKFPYCEARKKTFAYLEQRLSEIFASQHK